jgi:hypothetical protein
MKTTNLLMDSDLVLPGGHPRQMTSHAQRICQGLACQVPVLEAEASQAQLEPR